MKNLNDLIGTTNRGTYVEVGESVKYNNSIYTCAACSDESNASCKECDLRSTIACGHLQCGNVLREDKQNIVFKTRRDFISYNYY